MEGFPGWSARSMWQPYRAATELRSRAATGCAAWQGWRRQAAGQGAQDGRTSARPGTNSCKDGRGRPSPPYLPGGRKVRLVIVQRGHAGGGVQGAGIQRLVDLRQGEGGAGGQGAVRWGGAPMRAKDGGMQAPAWAIPHTAVRRVKSAGCAMDLPRLCTLCSRRWAAAAAPPPPAPRERRPQLPAGSPRQTAGRACDGWHGSRQNNGSATVAALNSCTASCSPAHREAGRASGCSAPAAATTLVQRPGGWLIGRLLGRHVACEAWGAAARAICEGRGSAGRWGGVGTCSRRCER